MPRGVSAPPGPVYMCRLTALRVNVEMFRLAVMVKIHTDDLIDAHGVAELLGLSHANSVSTYQRRYPDMPRPIIDLGRGRCRMWLRSEVLPWYRGRKDA